LKISLKDGVLLFQLSSRGLEPIAFLRQRILHLLHRCEIFVDSADPNDFPAGIQKRHLCRVIPGDSAIGMNKPFDFPDQRFFGFHDPLLVCRSLSCCLWRPEVNVGLPDDFVRISNAKVLSDRAACAKNRICSRTDAGPRRRHGLSLPSGRISRGAVPVVLAISVPFVSRSDRSRYT